MDRRDFVKAAFLSSLSGSFLFSNCSRFTKSTANYGLAYLKKSLEIFRKIQSYELPKLINAATRAAEIYKNSGRLLSRLCWGQIPSFETRHNRPGHPGYLTQLAWDNDIETLNTLQRGDFYMTNEVTDPVLQAKKRGCYIVGVSLPFLPNKFTKNGQIIVAPDWYTLEEVSSQILYSYIPDADGMVAFPEYPMVSLCPGSSLTQIAYFWMMNAEIGYLVQEKKTYPFISKARDYLEIIIERLYEIEKQLPLIKKAAETMARNVKAGGALYIYDQSNNLISEACNRASGLMMTKSLIPEQVKTNDNVILGAEASNDSHDIAMTQQLLDQNAFVVTISAFDTDGQTNGPRLYKNAPLALNNLSGESQGVVTLQPDKPKICPASGLMNVVLLWTLISQFISEMIESGLVPYIYMGEHLAGGSEYNAVMRRFFEERGF